MMNIQNSNAYLNTSIISLHYKNDQMLLFHIGKNAMEVLPQSIDRLEKNYDLCKFHGEGIESEGIHARSTYMITEILSAQKEKYRFAAIVLDSEDTLELALAKEIAQLLRDNGICVVGICVDTDITELDENEYPLPATEEPIELSMKDVCDRLDALVVARANHFKENTPYTAMLFQVTNMIVDIYLRANDENEKQDILTRIKNSGFAYYNLVEEENWNVEAATDFALFDSLFVCPFFVAHSAFCFLSYGNSFVTADDCNDMGDDGIAFSYIQDYLDPEVYFSTYSIRSHGLSEYDLKFQFLFFGFDGKNAVFNDEYSAQYPEATDKLLDKRIKRMLFLPWHNDKKRKNYEKYIEKMDTPIDIPK